MLEVSEVTELVAQVEAFSKKINSLLPLKVVIVMACKTYGARHVVTNYPTIGPTHGPNE